MKTKAIILILIISILIISAVVFGQTEEKMDIYGEIQKVVYDQSGNLKEIFIENIREDQQPYQEAFAIITDHTRILNGDEEKINDLTEGQVVGIIFKEGPVIMIYPPRIEAEKIKVKNSASPRSSKNDIMDQYNRLLQRDTDMNIVFEYVDNYISQLSRENAAHMINDLEKTQRKYLTGIEEKFFKSEIQHKIYNIYQPDYNPAKLNNLQQIKKIEDEELKGLLLKTRKSGYKIETAEGMFFPIVDYQYYQRLNSFLPLDLQEYIKIMALESSQVPAKDAALVIGWEQVLQRALTQEHFINFYPNSLKINQVKNLYKKYHTFIFFGLNNTPLFSYDSQMMAADAENIYQETVNNNLNKESKLIKTLSEFLDLVSENDNKLTAEVEQYRKSVIENL